jgi:polysaccharide export outer membrane protein
MSHFRRNWTLAILVAIWIVPGCRNEPVAPGAGAEPSVPEEFYQGRWEVQETPVAHTIRRDYRLREGDFLEIIYHVKRQQNPDYKIKIEDIIAVRFPFQPTLNQTEQVQSDGTLQLDLVGPVRVLDKTITEVQDDLVRRYANFIKNPVITVSFKQSNVKIAELKQAIQTAPRGQSRLVPVTPDGTISLPFIVDARAAGLTIGELHKALNAAYKDLGLEELEVTVNLQTVAPLRVYVMGEVKTAGVLFNRSGTDSQVIGLTLLQALAQAGGHMPPRAELSKVMLIRSRNLPHPQSAIVNVYQLLENRSKASTGAIVADMSKSRYDVWLEDGDIIYVPTSDIARRADYIDYVWTRGIRAVLGFTSTYTAADTVDWLGPNP